MMENELPTSNRTGVFRVIPIKGLWIIVKSEDVIQNKVPIFLGSKKKGLCEFPFKRIF